MLSVANELFMLSVIMLNVVMLTVTGPIIWVVKNLMMLRTR
jgi:hypothetical protein